jgi:hypothetical protein
MSQNAIPAAADSRNFFLGAASLYVKREGDVDYRYVGSIEGTSLNRTVEQVPIFAGFPKQKILEFTSQEEGNLTTTLRELSAKNLDLIVGSGVTAVPALTAKVLFVAYALLDATITLVGDQTALISAGQQYSITDPATGQTQVFMASQVDLVATETVITLPTDGTLLNAYPITAEVSRVAGEEVSAGGCPPEVELEALLVYTRTDGVHMAAQLFKMKVTGNMELALADAEENAVTVEWPLLADTSLPAGAQLFKLGVFQP